MQHPINIIIEDIRLKSIKELLTNDPLVSFAFVFGSYIKGRQEKAKDIDVAVYFSRPPEGIDSLKLINELSDLAGKEVDLVVLNRATAFLRHQIMKDGAPLLIKDRAVYIKFRDKTISDYDEYKFVSGMNVYDRYNTDRKEAP